MLHSEAGWRVGKPSFVTYRREPPASRTARFGSTCRSKPGRSPTSPAQYGGALTWLNRQCQFGSIREVPSYAWRGWAMRRPPPPRKKASARRREGLKPNSRDGKSSTGRSPKIRRHIVPTRPYSLNTQVE